MSLREAIISHFGNVSGMNFKEKCKDFSNIDIYAAAIKEYAIATKFSEEDVDVYMNLWKHLPLEGSTKIWSAATVSAPNFDITMYNAKSIHFYEVLDKLFKCLGSTFNNEADLKKYFKD